MRLNYSFTAISALFLLVATSGQVKADLILSFSESNVTLAIGQTVDIDIVLTQTSPAISGADIRTNGILLADIELLLSSNSSTVTSLGYGPGFENGSSSLADPFSPRLSSASIDVTNGVTAPGGDPTSITLGTFTFTANSAGTTDVTTVDTTFTDFIFATDPPGPHGPDIDNLIFGSETVRITAVPEPSAATGLVVGLLLLTQRRRRLKRNCDRIEPS